MAGRAHHQCKDKHSAARRRAECYVSTPVICRSRAVASSVAPGQPPSLAIPRNQCLRHRPGDCRAAPRLYRLGPHRLDQNGNDALPNQALVVHDQPVLAAASSRASLSETMPVLWQDERILAMSSVAASALPLRSAARNFITLTPIDFHAFPPYEPACRQLVSPNIATTLSTLTRNLFSKTKTTSSADAALRAASRIGHIARQASFRLTGSDTRYRHGSLSTNPPRTRCRTFRAS
jgi:hypothetical protein